MSNLGRIAQVGSCLAGFVLHGARHPQEEQLWVIAIQLDVAKKVESKGVRHLALVMLKNHLCGNLSDENDATRCARLLHVRAGFCN